MRKSVLLIAVALLVVTALPAMAELQNVQVGGAVRIRYNYYSNTFASPGAFQLQIPNGWLSTRPIGDLVTGANNIFSPVSWNNESNATKFTEERTRLNVKADFTNEVSMFIELDSYDIWGEDFRSNYITGVDGRAVSNNDVEVYQSYIEANNMWGMPLRARIGRQEMAFGSQFLMGTNDVSAQFQGLSFDALRLTYATDMFSVDAFAAKLAENGVAEEDGDTDLYGIYASYLGLEDITIDAYWMWLRDAQSLNDTNFTWFPEWLEDWFGVDDYDVTNLHTIGLRGAGTIGAFDFEAEVAYQFGDAYQQGFQFAPFVYGVSNSPEFDNWGVNLEAGYTFDMAWQPRAWLGYAYLSGEDNRAVNGWDLLWPWNKKEESVSFNRLFSNVQYSEFLDVNQDLSNAHVFRGGLTAQPTESVQVDLTVAYFMTDESFSSPTFVRLGGFNIPVLPFLPYWDKQNGDDLGWELGLKGAYHYSEDLTFTAGWSHLFTGDGLAEGNFNLWNGLLFDGGTSDDDADYVYAETCLKF